MEILGLRLLAAAKQVQSTAFLSKENYEHQATRIRAVRRNDKRQLPQSDHCSHM